jgi:hypothetical protein
MQGLLTSQPSSKRVRWLSSWNFMTCQQSGTDPVCKALGVLKTGLNVKSGLRPYPVAIACN